MGSLDAQVVQWLAAQAGAGRIGQLTPLDGGANNRVFRMETESGCYLLKSYFRHPEDPRDRLATEFAFAKFAWNRGVRSIPQPLNCIAEAGLGLFEFILGSSLRGSVAGEAEVDQAIDFYHALNQARTHPAAVKLPDASESCLSLEDHFATVSRRVARLQSLPVQEDIDASAAEFVVQELMPAWQEVLATARTAAAAHGLPLDVPLGASDRCLSPSDFGFHNAIRANDGRLRFIDFEYAGWDDPSRLICDFFCQPAAPAPLHAWDRFSHAITAELASPAVHLARSALLFPVYRVKWICIMLNDFLPVGGSRRSFSVPKTERNARKEQQLSKARAASAILHSTSGMRRVA